MAGDDDGDDMGKLRIMAATARTDRVAAPPRWAAPVSLLLCLLGLSVSVYIAVESSRTGELAGCAAGTLVDCGKVTGSAWSRPFGIPWTLLGTAYFVGMAALCLPAAWRRARGPVPVARIVGCALGLLTVGYLVWVELALVQAICLWCSVIHLTTFGLSCVVVAAWAVQGTPDGADER